MRLVSLLGFEAGIEFNLFGFVVVLIWGVTLIALSRKGRGGSGWDRLKILS